MTTQRLDIKKPKTKRVLMGIWLIRVAYAALSLSAILDLVASPKEELILSLYLSIAVRVLAAGVLIFAETLVHKGQPKKAGFNYIFSATLACLLQVFFLQSR